MALLWAWLAAVSCAIAVASEAGTAGVTGEPLVQIDATGSMRSAHQATDDNSERLMRQEVRRHIQEGPEKLEFDQLDEVGCPIAHGLESDSADRKFCKILTGSNTEVAGKLEHAVKGLILTQNPIFKKEASSLLEEKHSKGDGDTDKGTPVTKDSKFAEDVLTGLLHGSDKTKIQKRLWNAINKLDIQKVLEDDIVKIEDDSDGNYKALKANLMLLHECASMKESDCNPKSPKQDIYKDARNAAYEAYHNIQHDDSLVKQTYLDLLSTVASGKHKDYYPPSHPLYVATTKEEEEETTTEAYEPVNITEPTNVSDAAPPVEEGNMLLIAICVVTGIVIIAIAFLLHKTNEMNHGKGGGGGGGGHGEAAWGGEGEYGNY